MAKSFYKGERLGKLPPCVICAGAGDGPRQRVFLTHGVSRWLCGAHRSDDFLTRRAGRDFVASVGAMWSGAGCFGHRRRKALEAHLRRVRQPRAAPRRPGSYAWPELRAEAERRFAAGEPPAQVIDDLRGRHAEGPARAPAVSTMRRWFADGRWLGWATSAVRDASRRAVSALRAAAAAGATQAVPAPIAATERPAVESVTAPRRGPPPAP